MLFICSFKMIKDNSVIVFQGDSVTDSGRTYDRAENDMGVGYPQKVKEFVQTFFADKNITVLNRGISGNRAIDLRNRWDEDCIDLKPDYVSILIGINDTWRRYDANNPTTAQAYEDNYRNILERTKKANPDCQVIMLEPFIIPSDETKLVWYEDLYEKQLAARKLSREFNTIYIPLDGFFASSSIKTAPAVWSEDGVHPTDAGHSLIARLWIDIVFGTNNK